MLPSSILKGTIMSKYIYLFFIALLFPSVSNAGWFGASNYNECVLESMKGVTSDAAAGVINRACRAKFPFESHSDSEVQDNIVRQLDGSASYSNGYFKGTIYNGNKDWTITQLTLVLTPKSKDKSIDQTRRAKAYNVNIVIPPLTNKEFIELVASDDLYGFDWNISNARGYQK